MPISDRDKLRLLVSDVGGDSGTSFVFTDEDLDTFLQLRYGNVLLAAALALNTLAANEALVSKRITFLELTTDGPAVAAELRQLAMQFITQAHEAAGVRVGFEP